MSRGNGELGKKGQWDKLEGTNEGALEKKKAMGSDAIAIRLGKSF